MTTEQLNQAFADTHKFAATLGNDLDRYEPFRRYFKYDVIDPLVKDYKKEHSQKKDSTVSWGDSYLAVRDAYTEYVGTLFPREGITARPISGLDFESKQMPVLDDEGKFHCCYRRNKAGLAAFRSQTCTLNGQELISWYHHASPVPYEVTDKEERRRLTIQNLHQLATQDPGKPIAEVRLLSPLTGLKATLASPFAQKYFTQLNDYDQLLETAVAAELSGLDITLFNFGVNGGRHLTNELQTQLNIRALKKLYAKITGAPSPKRFELTSNAEQSFLKQLAEHNSEDYADLPQNIDDTPATEKQKELFKTLMHLLSSGDWKKNNFMAQAILVILLHSFGYLTATGCNDAKDRDGALTNYIEAMLVYINTSKLSFDEIHKQVRENSTARKVAEQISIPNVAKELDVKGNPHRKISRTFKHLFTEDRHEHYKALDRMEAEEVETQSDAEAVPTLPAESESISLTTTQHTAPLIEAVNEKKGWWTTLCEIGTAIKNFLVSFFTPLLLAVGLISVAQAGTLTAKDGASSPSSDSGYSVSLPGEDQTPPAPQPASKRDDFAAVDDAISEDEEEHLLEDDDDILSSGNSSGKSSPQLSRKDDNPVKTWKEVVQERGNVTNLSVIERARLMGIRGTSKSENSSLSVSRHAEEERDNITRRKTF